MYSRVSSEASDNCAESDEDMADPIMRGEDCDGNDDGGGGLVVLQVLPAMTLGGVERGVLEVAIYLRSQDVGAIVASANGPLVAQLTTHKILHCDLAVLRSKNPLNVLWRAPRALRHIIRTHHVTLVHARSRTSAWSAFLAVQSTAAQLVTTHHGAYGLDKALWKKAVARVMLWGAGLIMPSSFMCEFVCRHQGVRVTEKADAGQGNNEAQPIDAVCSTLMPVATSRVLLGAQQLLALLHWAVLQGQQLLCGPIGKSMRCLLDSSRWPLVAVIPRGVDVSSFMPDSSAAAGARLLSREWQLRSGQTHVLHFGRMSAQKGGLDFLRAMHLVIEQASHCDDICALVVGSNNTPSSSKHSDAIAQARAYCCFGPCQFFSATLVFILLYHSGCNDVWWRRSCPHAPPCERRNRTGATLVRICRRRPVTKSRSIVCVCACACVFVCVNVCARVCACVCVCAS